MLAHSLYKLLDPSKQKTLMEDKDKPHAVAAPSLSRTSSAVSLKAKPVPAPISFSAPVSKKVSPVKGLHVCTRL